jgi:predicted kinase
MTKKLIMTKGLPGSGKSTWADEFVLAAPAGAVVRINKDTLRAMLHADRFKGSKTEYPTVSARDALVTLFLGQGRTVVVDDTNLEPTHEINLRSFAENLGAEFEIKDFTDVPLNVCIERDRKRARTVGPKVINKMYQKYLAKPTLAPPFDPALPSAIIVDIDGTLAHMNGGRSPYDYTNVKQDGIDHGIRRLVQLEKERGTTVIIVSGRDGVCYGDSREWLESHDVPYDLFFIRAPGDSRDDRIIKSEIFDAHIRDQYNVLYVLDDRDRVVQMWRSLGLKCLQVAEGDF